MRKLITYVIPFVIFLYSVLLTILVVNTFQEFTILLEIFYFVFFFHQNFLNIQIAVNYNGLFYDQSLFYISFMIFYDLPEFHEYSWKINKIKTSFKTN